MTLTTCPCSACVADQAAMSKQPEYEQFSLGQQVEVIAGYYTGNKGTVIHLQPQPDGSAIVQVQWRNHQTKYIPSFALADNTTLQQAWDALQRVPAYVERRQEETMDELDIIHDQVNFSEELAYWERISQQRRLTVKEKARVEELRLS